MATARISPSVAAFPDENTMFLDILHEAPLFGHRKPTSIVWSIFYCIVLAGFAILAAGATLIFQPLLDLLSPLLCSCHVVLLILTGIFQQHLVYQAQKTRLQGYYIFSQKLKHIIRLPFAIFSYGTAAVLLIIVWRPDIGFISISTLVRIIILVEVLCAGFFMIIYIAHIQQYNALDSQPDVLKSLYSPLQPSSSVEGSRYHDGGRLSDQQMALLEYQRENIHFLSEEILRLQECLSKYERSNDGSTPQVDLAHLLAAREHELRTTSAEINQLQSELTLARSVIADRDSEIQRIRSINSQYVEENDRLRAILGEWSTRAARLERALEAERLANLELQKKVTMKSQTSLESASEPT